MRTFKLANQPHRELKDGQVLFISTGHDKKKKDTYEISFVASKWDDKYLKTMESRIRASFEDKGIKDIMCIIVNHLGEFDFFSFNKHSFAGYMQALKEMNDKYYEEHQSIN